MKVSEICEAVRRDEITIDVCDHRCNDVKQNLLRWYDHQVEYANGKGDGGWNKDGKDTDRTSEEWDADMRAHYQRSLDHEVEEDSPLSYMEMENYCFECGRRYHLILRNNKLELRRWFDPDAPSERWGSGNHVVDEEGCQWSDPAKQVYGGEFDITSELAIANFFVGLEADAPEEHEHSEAWSLNCTAGRIRRSQWKLENQGVAYGQLTNTTIGVYVHPNKKSVILGPAYLADHRAEELTEEQYDALTDADWDELRKIDGHEMVGELDARVWRWEAADKKRLGESFKATKEADHAAGPIVVKVAKGRWKFTHYFDSFRGERDDEAPAHVWAKLELV